MPTLSTSSSDGHADPIRGVMMIEHNAQCIAKKRETAIAFYESRIRAGFKADYPYPEKNRWVVEWTFPE